MSEPARHFPPHETASRPTPGPLRDWLAAMKAQAPAEKVPPRSEPARVPEPAWTQRAVPSAGAALDGAESEDLSELMAENLMLKAKLRLETDRYAELQAMLAQEIRELRRHVQDEMSELQAIREERDLWQARAEALAQPLFQKR
ncbi:hypothetical protein [Methylobacterium nigriterrae]|uniref:hypothetical protein n=1 Tax=Methylobacterium nigriterrae TaxID=3127512 RepID=UPI0030141339